MTLYPDQGDLEVESPSIALPEPAGLASRLRALTPARVGLSRAGESIATQELLDFQLAHALARDAVHAALQPASLISNLLDLAGQGAVPEFGTPLLLHSAARDRTTYLQRPDLGRLLALESRERLKQLRRDSSFDLALIIVDGLAALAVERHTVPLLKALLPALSQSSPPLRMAPLCVVEQGRVAIGDEIAHELAASLVVVLIGERPGLSSPDSLGAYITWRPRPGQTTDAARNCISNIRLGGLAYDEAASRLLYYIQEGTRRQLTGVGLKDPDALQLSIDREMRLES